MQPDYLRALAQAHEASGFDRVLIPHSSSMVDGFIIADQTLAATDRLGVLLAHRPGFVAPTQVARKYATIDAFHPGRIAMHVISGGDDADQARDGDWIDKPSRYRRSGEFLEIVKQGQSIFLQLQAALWEQRRLADRLALTTPALTYRIAGDGGSGMVITSQFGDRATHADVRVPVPLRVDLGPASVLADERAYHLRAQLTLATIADRDIDQFGTAIFGDPQSAAGLAGLGRFVFGTLLRIGKYLESESAETTSGRYSGLRIRSGP